MMMRTPPLYLLWVLLLCLGSSHSVYAQTQFLKSAQERLDSEEPGSLAALDAAIDVQFGWSEIDLEECAKRSSKNLKLARRLKNEDAIAVTTLLDLHAKFWLTGTRSETEKEEKALLAFSNETAPAKWRMIYWDTMINRQLNHSSKQSPDSEFYKHYDKALEECEDEERKLRFAVRLLTLKASEISSKQVKSESFKQLFKHVVAKRELLKDDPQFNAGYHLIRAFCAQKENDLEAYRKEVAAIEKVIGSTGENILPTLFYAIQSIYQMVLMQPSKAADELEKSLPSLRRLKSDEMRMTLLAAMLDFRLSAGEIEKAGTIVTECDALEEKKLRPWTRHAYYTTAAKYYRATDDLENLHKCTVKLSSPRFLRTLSRSKMRDTEEVLNAELLRAQVAQTLRSLEVVEKERTEMAQRADKFKSLWLNTLLGLGLASLLALLFYTRRNLSLATTELSQEQQETKKHLEIRKTLEQKINRLQRMESLGLLAGGIAHDFNNLLVGVIGNAELIEANRGDGSPEFSQQRARQILVSATKAAELSKQMLAYAGKNDTEKVKVDLGDLIKDLTPVLQSTNSEHELKFELVPKPLESWIDRTQIDQILLNLVVNAAQANSKNESITIRTGNSFVSAEQLQTDSMLFGTRSLGGEFVFFEVEDSGSGISSEDLERIFEPFFTDSSHGRGLGLAVVYGLVSAHDGIIQIETEEGKGTTIRVYLPAQNDSKPKNVAAKKFPRSVGMANKHVVLLVDDDESILEWLQIVLELEGFEVQTATDGELAIEKIMASRAAKNDAARVNCVVLDVQMPKVSGPEFLDFLREKEFRLPVLMTSGYSRTKLSQFRGDPNVAAILVKPFEISRLVEAINQVVHGKVKA